MKHILLASVFCFIGVNLQAQDKVYISDTLISHYIKDGKISSPLEDEGNYHRKTRRKKASGPNTR